MADLVMRWDESAGYGYLTSGDGYAIPRAEWSELSDKRGPYRAEYSAEHPGELRLQANRVLEVVTYLEAEGHRVQRTKGPRASGPRRYPCRQECTVCGHDYPPGYRPAVGETCAEGRTVHVFDADHISQGTRLEHDVHPLELRESRAP